MTMKSIHEALEWISGIMINDFHSFDRQHPGLLDELCFGETEPDQLGWQILLRGEVDRLRREIRQKAAEELAHSIDDRRRLIFGLGGELIVSTLGIAVHCLDYGLTMPGGVRKHLIGYLRRKAKLGDQQWNDPQEALAELRRKYLAARPAKKSGRPPLSFLLAVAVCALENELPIPADLLTPLVSYLDGRMTNETKDVKASALFKNRAEEARWHNQMLAGLIEEIQSKPDGWWDGEGDLKKEKLSMEDAAALLLREHSRQLSRIGLDEHRAELKSRILAAQAEGEESDLSDRALNAKVDLLCREARKERIRVLRSLGLLRLVGNEDGDSLARRIREAKLKEEQLDLRAECERRWTRLKQMLRFYSQLSREDRHRIVREEYRAEE